MDKQNKVYPYNRVLFNNKKIEVRIHATLRMNHEDITLSERDNTHTIVYSPIHMKYPEWETLIEKKHRLAIFKGW